MFVWRFKLLHIPIWSSDQSGGMGREQHRHFADQKAAVWCGQSLTPGTVAGAGCQHQPDTALFEQCTDLPKV